MPQATSPRSTASAPQRSNPVKPLEAFRGIRELVRNPDDTKQVFRVIRALAGNSIERNFRRFVETANGRRILAERRSLVDRLSDRAYLASLPEGTLGRAYADFTAREEISADGLVDASTQAAEESQLGGPVGFDRQLFSERLRDMHDLWHIVTGYQRDLIGEGALLAFTYRQTRNRGIGFIVAVAYLKAGRRYPQQRELIRDGWRRGSDAEWLPAADWETLLAEPLEEVRRKLKVEPAPSYEAVRSQGAPALA